MILFISHSAGRTGAPMVLLHLLRWLRENTDHECRIIVRGDGPLVDCFREVGETLVVHPPPQILGGRIRRTINRLRGQQQAVAWPRLPESWADQPWRLVYSNTATNGDLVSRLMRPGIPVITHVHEMSYWIGRAGPANWDLVKQQTTRYIAVSEAVRSYLVGAKGLDPGAVDLVHEFVPEGSAPAGHFSGLRKELGIPEHSFIVGGSGAESWRKGRDLFVQLAGMVRRMLPDREVHFIWVGDTGDLEEQQRLQHDAVLSGAAERLHWIGEVPEPGRYFAQIDLFAMVSREDPFPLVCLEAALMEKPLLCFAEAGGIPELVEEDGGFVVPYLDLYAMAGRILELAQNPALTKAQGARAREKVLERHTVAQTGPVILRLMNRELGTR